MTLLTHETPVLLWQEVVKNAESHCSIVLNQDLEAYLISLLVRYTNKPEIAQQVFANAYLDALQKQQKHRSVLLQAIGDQCLIYAGLFPAQAEKRHVKLAYFVGLGQSAYSMVSPSTNDLYSVLALKFVTLMDVLQSIRPTTDMLPLQAYERWHELGSQYAWQMLQKITKGVPPTRISR